MVVLIDIPVAVILSELARYHRDVRVCLHFADYPRYLFLIALLAVKLEHYGVELVRVMKLEIRTVERIKAHSVGVGGVKEV